MNTETRIPDVVVFSRSKMVQPKTKAGDEFFGLLSGTNGTAAETRRKLIEGIVREENLRWRTSAGGHAIGVNLSPPMDEPDVQPWFIG